MGKILAAITLALALAGCTASASGTKKATVSLTDQFVGKPADEFFLNHGPPHSTHQLDSGSKMYLWAENATVYNLNGGLFNSSQTLSTNSPVKASAGSIAVQCEVRIVASADGIIRQMAIQNDTIGNWQLSRCAEKFAGRAKPS